MPEPNNELTGPTEVSDSEIIPEKEDRKKSRDKYLSPEPVQSGLKKESVLSENNGAPDENKQSVWDRFLYEAPVEKISVETKPSAGANAAAPYRISAPRQKTPQTDIRTDITPAQPPDESLYKKLDGIQADISHLRDEFRKKLMYDAHKDKQIDNLYQELQGYKNDFIKKHLKSMMLDMIKIIDNIRKLSNHYNSQDISAVDTGKLVELLNNIPSDLEDVFYWQNVRSFTSGDLQSFDPTRQRVLKTVQTSDKEKDKLVAESMRPGYEWDGQIIRPEMVSVYTYKEITDQKEEIRSSDE